MLLAVNPSQSLAALAGHLNPSAIAELVCCKYTRADIVINRINSLLNLMELNHIKHMLLHVSLAPLLLLVAVQWLCNCGQKSSCSTAE